MPEPSDDPDRVVPDFPDRYTDRDADYTDWRAEGSDGDERRGPPPGGDVGAKTPEPSAIKFLPYWALLLTGTAGGVGTLQAAFHGSVLFTFASAAVFGLSALVFCVQIWQALLMDELDESIHDDAKYPKND